VTTSSGVGEQDKTELTTTRVLLVDDDTGLCAQLQRLLRIEGFAVEAVHTADDGARRALDEAFALIVLDVMLPGGDGRMVLRKIRAQSDVPVIMLTARGDEGDRIAGLEAGADDYLPKPFNARELVARMRAVLKRRVPNVSQPHAVTVGDLEIHPLTRRVLREGVEVSLTGAEFDILLLLIKSAGKPVSRDEIAEICLGRAVAPFDRSVDNHVSNLRKKLGTLYQETERIRSLRGIGYVYTGQTETE
jgi:two-component system, OmpR family, response regulator CpxR